MEYYNEDNLNSLIRWAVYAYGYDFEDCITVDYEEVVERLANTNWETQVYQRRNIFQLIHPSPTENNKFHFF